MALSKSEQVHFVERILVLLDAGLPLLQSIGLAKQSTPPAWNGILSNIETGLCDGKPFSVCLSRHSGVLDSTFLGLIQVSEQSGDIALALRTIHEQLSAQIELSRKIQQALIYPLVTLGSAMLLLLAMIIWVIPVFSEVFAHFNASLPWSTQLLLDISMLIQANLMDLTLVFVAMASGFCAAWYHVRPLQQYCDRLLFRLPVLGDLFRLSALAYWCRSLGHLMQAGLPALDAMRTTGQSANQWLSHDVSAHAFKYLAQGYSFGEALRRADPHHHFFDRETWQLLCIGSESSSLAVMLRNRADVLSRRLSDRLNLLSHSLEPLLITIVGVLIGGLVIILYLPIFNLGNIV
ncbi:MAG: type II secretion system F family protein [Polynucleobacter sp.]|nr:type II secretion system F family protein [Polynucleobacter sp.]MDZ4056433.1 type II secretion system F family protein [Polynucleobacter sp.]